MKAVVFLCFVSGLVVGYMSVLLLVSYSTFDLLSYSVSPVVPRGPVWRSTTQSHASTTLLYGGKKTCPPVIKVVALIFSSPVSDRRQSARETWLKAVPTNMKLTYKFLIGTEGLEADVLKRLESEQTEYGDLLLFSEIKDSFKNLTSKLRLGMIWVHERTLFHYFFKVDDDCYVRLDQMETAFRNMTCLSNLHWGYFSGGAWPQPQGKYYETQWFMCERYVTYAMGAGYILSRPMFSLVMQFSDKLITKYNNDDINVALWLAPLDLYRLHDQRFDFHMQKPACNSNIIVSHRHTNESLYSFHQMITSGNLKCQEWQETQARYIYNWYTDSVDCCRYSRAKVKHNSYSSLGTPRH